MATVRALRPAPGRLRSRHLADAARHLAHDTARIARFSIGIFSAAQQLTAAQAGSSSHGPAPGSSTAACRWRCMRIR